MAVAIKRTPLKNEAQPCFSSLIILFKPSPIRVSPKREGKIKTIYKNCGPVGDIGIATLLHCSITTLLKKHCTFVSHSLFRVHSFPIRVNSRILTFEFFILKHTLLPLFCLLFLVCLFSANPATPAKSYRQKPWAKPAGPYSYQFPLLG